MPSTIPLQNPDALITGAGEFRFAPGATSLADARNKGWIDFGNIVATGIKPQIDKLDHVTSVRGVRRVNKTVATKGELMYTIQCDELDVEKLKIALGGTDGTDFTQSAHTTANGNVLAFSTTAAVIGRWYDLRVSGVPVREVTTVTITGKTEDVDFVVDKKLGAIRFLTAQSADLTPVITAAAVTAGGTGFLQAINPLNSLMVRGYGRLSIFDGNTAEGLVYDHTDFSCECTFESMDDVQGTDWVKVTINVRVTSDLGTVWTPQKKAAQ